MIIDENKTTSQGVGMKEQRDFTANLDGMMFDNMINGIYSDKIAAPIRELSTNARDGHAAVGKLNEPFDVTLPTRLNPEFKVRDFGCSLTHEEVMDMYSVLGMSTKRTTNEQTGCLGLGSKSPFAYTSTFSVTCWMDGEKRVYSAFKQTGGTPAIALVHRTKSSEPTGVEVGFAVNAADVQNFNNTAKNVFIGFLPRPNIIQSAGFEWDDRIPVINSTHGEIYKKESGYNVKAKSFAIQGSVAYPLVINDGIKTAIYALSDVEKPTRYPYKAAEEMLMDEADLRLYFDIGELTMTTSREELAYNTTTCHNIAKKLHALIQEQEKTINSRWEKEKSYFEATKKFTQDVADNNTVSKIAELVKIPLKPEWKGKTLYSHYTFTNDQYSESVKCTRASGNFYNTGGKDVEDTIKDCVFTRMSEMQVNQKFGEMKKSFSFVKASQSTIRKTFIELQKTKFYVQETGDSYKINNRIREIWADLTPGENPIYVNVNKLSDWDTIRKIMMIPNKNITYMKDVEGISMPKQVTAAGTVTTTPTTVEVRKIQPSRWGSNSSSHRTKIDLTDKNTKYIRVWQKGREFYYNKADWEAETNGCQLQSMMYNLDDNSSYITKTVIALNKTNAKLNEDFGHLFVEYEDEVANALRSKLGEADKLIKRSNLKVNLGSDEDFYMMLKLVDSTNLPKFLSGVPAIIKAHSEARKQELNATERQMLSDLERSFPKEMQAMRQKYTTGGYTLLNVELVKKEYVILSMMFKHWQSCINRFYSANKTQDTAEFTAALNEYLNILKKDGK